MTVAFRKTAPTIFCDAPDCKAAWVDSSSHFPVHEARIDAKTGGWAFADGKDYCREHTPVIHSCERCGYTVTVRQAGGER